MATHHTNNMWSKLPPKTPRDVAATMAACAEVARALQARGYACGVFREEIGGGLTAIVSNEDDDEVDTGVALPHGATIASVRDTEYHVVQVPRRYTVNWRVAGRRLVFVGVAGLVAVAAVVVSRMAERGRFSF